MFIKNCLTQKRDLELLSPTTTIGESLARMKAVKAFSLPVVDSDGNFTGLLSKQSMFEYLENHPNDFTFAEFLEQPLSICVDTSAKMFVDIDNGHFEDLLPIIVRYPFVPIVENSTKFVGIVKRSEIEKALEASFGLHVPGIRLLLAVDDTEGTLLNISQIIYKHGVKIVASIAFEAGESFVRRIMMKIDENDRMDKIVEEIEAHGYRVLEVSYDNMD